MYIKTEATISKTPENFIKNSEILEKFLTPFINEVKTPAKITITPCPSENNKSINPARAILLLNAAKLIIPAKIGVEQGLTAKANKTPTKKGYKNKL